VFLKEKGGGAEGRGKELGCGKGKRVRKAIIGERKTGAE